MTWAIGVTFCASREVFVPLDLGVAVYPKGELINLLTGNMTIWNGRCGLVLIPLQSAASLMFSSKHPQVACFDLGTCQIAISTCCSRLCKAMARRYLSLIYVSRIMLSRLNDQRLIEHEGLIHKGFGWSVLLAANTRAGCPLDHIWLPQLYSEQC